MRSLLGQAPAFTHNILLGWKVITCIKHSSLFGPVNNVKEKKVGF
jgi:hypothetical protein